MPDITLTWTGVSAAKVTEIQEAVAFIYGGPTTGANVKRVLWKALIKPAIQAYRLDQAGSAGSVVDMATESTDFGTDIADDDAS
jgi:hypothetical protein